MKTLMTKFCSKFQKCLVHFWSEIFFLLFNLAVMQFPYVSLTPFKVSEKATEPIPKKLALSWKYRRTGPNS